MSNYREQLGNMPSQFRQGGVSIPWSHQEVKISGNGLTTVHFDTSKPNMFMLQNPNDTTIHIGISRIPTAKNYEFKIESNSSVTFGRPVPTDALYILNKGNADAVISLFSIYDKFDMSILQTLNVDLSKSPIYDGIINGFGNGVSLPSGTNKIGSVEVSKMVFPDGFLTAFYEWKDVQEAKFNNATDRWFQIGSIYNNGGEENSSNVLNSKVVKKIKSITNFSDNALKVMLYSTSSTSSYKMFMVAPHETIRELWTPDTRKIVVETYGTESSKKNAFNMVYLYEAE